MSLRIIRTFLYGLSFSFVASTNLQAQSASYDAEVPLLLPRSLTWDSLSPSQPENWDKLAPWVNSLEQRAETKATTTDEVFRLLQEAAEEEFPSGSPPYSFSFSTNLVAKVEVPTMIVRPDANWIKVEEDLGLDAMGSVRLRLALAQAIEPGSNLPESEAELLNFVSTLDPEVQDRVNRAICPECYIIDGPSFTPVSLPIGGSGLPVLMADRSRALADNHAQTDREPIPTQEFEARMIAATVFIVGKKTAEARLGGSDGSISFPYERTFQEVLYGENQYRICSPGLQGFIAMEEYHKVRVLAGCGGVIVKDSQERAWLMTAKHCLKTQVNAEEMLLLSDRIVRGSLSEMAYQSPNSSDYHVVKPFPKAHPHPSADVVLFELPADLAAKALPLPDRGSMRVSEGQSVTALSFPLGLPLTFVQGEDTVVSQVAPDSFWARIDNFSVSSGSPVFTDWGALEGILVRQPNPDKESMDLWDDGNCYSPRVESSGGSLTARLGAEVIDARLALEILDTIK